MHEHFTVQFVPSKTCFLYFSHKWFQRLNSPKFPVLKLKNGTKCEAYLTWGPQPVYALNDCTVGINATFAYCLGLSENDYVTISALETVSSLQRIQLTPCSEDDYEILELCKDVIESSLLNQIRVVYKGEVLSVWVSKSMHLTLTVDLLEPNLTYGRLEQFTELVILDVNLKHIIPNRTCWPSGSLPMQSDTTGHLWQSVSQYLSSANKTSTTMQNNSLQHVPNNLFENRTVCSSVYRVHPVEVLRKNCCSNVHNSLLNPYNVFVPELHMPEWAVHEYSVGCNNTATLCELTVVNCKKRNKHPGIVPKSEESNNKDQDTNQDGNNLANSLYVRLYGVKRNCKTLSQISGNTACVYVSQTIREYFNLNVGSKVKLKYFVPDLDHILQGIEVFVPENVVNKDIAELEDILSNHLRNQGNVLVNNNALFPIRLGNGSVVNTHVTLYPEVLTCWPLTWADWETCDGVVCQIKPPYDSYGRDIKFVKRSSDMEGIKPVQSSTKDIRVFDELLHEGVSVLTMELGLSVSSYMYTSLNQDNLLITGKCGAGKTTLANNICKHLSSAPHFVHSVKINCKSLKGKKPDSIKKTLVNALAEGVYYQPSIILLDDIDSIACVTKNTEEKSSELYYMRVASVIVETLHQVCGSRNRIAVVATAVTKSSLNPQMLAARGRHFFTSFLRIPPLNKSDRIEIIKSLTSARIPDAITTSLRIDTVAAKTDGYVIQDLSVLVDKALFVAYQDKVKNNAEELRFSVSCLEEAIVGCVPRDLVNISLRKSSPHTWHSIGGLSNVKNILTEVLIWPSKYPEVFEQLPLPGEKGVLLYGAPGTGKTLLAAAVAGESGLNFLSVKGPELLSKYIGASEEAVRSIFHKAQNAKPCIIFFDEFESLAPRRGHDNTGVTDRVVNQLLTQLDGVETLEGVWVLAAASRPDLLDPALLRPGRIGTAIFCPLPDKNDRKLILETLGKKLQFADDVNLAEIAEKTEGFTGADLQAVLYAAQMLAYDVAVHEVKTMSGAEDNLYGETMKSFDEHEELDAGQLLVTQKYLLAAVGDTTPSLSPRQKEKFQLVYKRFEALRQGRAQDKDITVPSQRITLA